MNGVVTGTDRTLTAIVTVGARSTEEIVADLSRRTGDFRGSASQNPPFGTQHPGGDAFDIEDTFFDKHGEDLAARDGIRRHCDHPARPPTWIQISGIAAKAAGVFAPFASARLALTFASDGVLARSAL